MIVWLITLLCLLVPWILIGSNLVRKADQAYFEYNEKEWHIDQLPLPTFVVRFINAGGFGSGFAPLVLWIVDFMLVQPALAKSLQLMEQVDSEGVVPKILCSQEARQDMKERIQVYHNSILASSTVTPVGKIVKYVEVYYCLCNHHGVLQMGMKPEVHAQQVKAPLFIASLPRTGTTILHRTMALDQTQFRNFDLCDMVCPLPEPIPRWDLEGRSWKANEAEPAINSLTTLYPGWMECMETMHGVRPGEANEDSGWYDCGLGHSFLEAVVKVVPEYRKMNGKLTGTKVAEYRYAWLHMILKLYQWTDEAEWTSQNATSASERESRPCPTRDLPWLLKDPYHSAHLPHLLRQFPDAKLVFTHRHPRDIVASMAKLFVVNSCVEHIPGAPGTSAAEWGREALLLFQEMCGGMVEFTKAQESNGPHAVGGENRLDLEFSALVQDVPGTIDAIYKRFYPDRAGPSEAAKKLFADYLERNDREKLGNQQRSLEEFHLTKEEVDAAFAEYNKLFMVA